MAKPASEYGILTGNKTADGALERIPLSQQVSEQVCFECRSPDISVEMCEPSGKLTYYCPTCGVGRWHTMPSPTSAKVGALLGHLALAYGGHSQYRLEDVGRALAGQVNNQGWQESFETLSREAAALLAERWDDQRVGEDAAAIRQAAEAAWQELRRPRPAYDGPRVPYSY